MYTQRYYADKKKNRTGKISTNYHGMISRRSSKVIRVYIKCYLLKNKEREIIVCVYIYTHTPVSTQYTQVG